MKIYSRWIMLSFIPMVVFFIYFPSFDLYVASTISSDGFSYHDFFRWVHGEVSHVSRLISCLLLFEVMIHQLKYKLRLSNNLFLLEAAICQFLRQNVWLIYSAALLGEYNLLLLEMAAYRIVRQTVYLSYNSALFYLLAWMIGPGLIVNFILKDHIGRPRPKHIVNFKGEHRYVPAFKVSNACRRNCAFVSGHAAFGFMIISVAFVFPAYRRRLFFTGLITGSAIGLVRMLQGGHFLSDVIFSFYATYLGIYFAHHLTPYLQYGAFERPELLHDSNTKKNLKLYLSSE